MTTQRDSLRFSATFLVLTLMAVATPTHGQAPPAGAGGARAKAAPADPLYQGFVDPPPAARPRVWWHWMNGNVTKEGIRRDLEWMKRVGLGGFQNFDASLFGDTVVDKRVAYMTPEWKDAFRYAIELADRLGLETAIAGSPGWSESGGPWVEPEQAMKKLVWSETRVQGGQPFTGALPKPPTTSGPFQNVPVGELFSPASCHCPSSTATSPSLPTVFRRATRTTSARSSRRAAAPSTPRCCPTAISSDRSLCPLRPPERRPGSSSSTPGPRPSAP